MLQVFLIDDEPHALVGLQRLLKEFFPEVEVCGMATNIGEALQGILLNRPQLILLDIELGSESAFDLLNKFDSIPFHIVFITAHSEYAVRAFKVSALDYLLKPVGIPEIEVVLRKVRQQTNDYTQQHQKLQNLYSNSTHDHDNYKICITEAGTHEFIRLCDLLYIKADRSYSQFYLQGGKSLLTSKPLGHYSPLLEPCGFYRIHSSVLVNTRHIQRIHSGGSKPAVVMENGQVLNMARNRKKRLLQALKLK